MAGTRKVKRTVGELQDVEVVRLSLVDRGAIRVPFRMMKQEDAAVLDFDGIFKRAGAEARAIKVAAVAVGKDAMAGAKVEDVSAAIEGAGLSTESAKESNGDRVYLQVPEAEVDLGKCQRVKVADGVHVLVTGAEAVLEKAAASFDVGDESWIPGLEAASSALSSRLDEAVEKGEDLPAAVKAATEDFYAYAAVAATLPASVLKLEAALGVLADSAPEKPVEASAPAEPEAEPTQPEKGDQGAPTAEPTAPTAPTADKSVVEQVVEALAPRFQAIEQGVAAAKAEPAEAVKAAKQRSLPAAPADPAPIKLRGQPAQTSKRAVPLLDTARERPSDG